MKLQLLVFFTTEIDRMEILVQDTRKNRYKFYIERGIFCVLFELIEAATIIVINISKFFNFLKKKGEYCNPVRFYQIYER